MQTPQGLGTQSLPCACGSICKLWPSVVVVPTVAPAAVAALAEVVVVCIHTLEVDEGSRVLVGMVGDVEVVVDSTDEGEW